MKNLHVNVPRWYQWRPFIYTALLAVPTALCLAEMLNAWLMFLVGLVIPPVIQTYVDALHLGSIEMNERFIRRTSRLGSFQLAWDEIQRIDMPAKGTKPIALYGNSKQLAIANPHLWTGEDKEQTLELFNRQVEKRGIFIRPSKSTSWAASKNTKLSYTTQPLTETAHL